MKTLFYISLRGLRRSFALVAKTDGLAADPRSARATRAIASFFVILATLACIALAPSSADAATKRSKVIDFEDEVVEGMSKRPLDSLNQVSEKDRKKRRPHLYRKRAGFRSETYDSLRSTRYTP